MSKADLLTDRTRLSFLQSPTSEVSGRNGDFKIITKLYAKNHHDSQQQILKKQTVGDQVITEVINNQYSLYCVFHLTNKTKAAEE